MKIKFWESGTPPVQTMEECAEVIHIICKGMRFGWHNYHPDDPEQTSNIELARRELRDLERRIVELKAWLKEEIRDG